MRYDENGFEDSRGSITDRQEALKRWFNTMMHEKLIADFINTLRKILYKRD